MEKIENNKKELVLIYLLIIGVFAIIIISIIFTNININKIKNNLNNSENVFFVKYDKDLNYTLIPSNITNYLNDNCKFWYKKIDLNISGYVCNNNYVIEVKN